VTTDTHRSPRVTSFVREAILFLSKRDRRVFVLLAIGRTAMSAIDLIAILALGVGVDRMSSETERTAAPFLILAGTGMLVRSLGTLVIARMTFRFLSRVEVSIGDNFTNAVFAAPQEALDGLRTQELAFALSQGVNSLTTRALGFAMIAVADGLAAVVLVVAFTVVYPVEGLLMVSAVFSLMMPVQRAVSKRIHLASSQWSNATMRVWSEVSEFQASRREIFLNSASESTARRLGESRRVSARQAAEFNFLLTVPRVVIEAATIVVAAILLFVAFLRQSDEGFIVFSATLMAITFRVAPLAMGAVSALGVITQSQGETVVNRRIREAIGSTGIGQKPISIQSSTDDSRDIAVELQEVSYFFPGASTPVLSSVSLRVLVNEICAIVGPSGAGKTTLLECIVGLREVTTGQVFLMGSKPEVVRHVSPGSIGLVTQAPAIRSASIVENVTFLSPDVPDRDLVKNLLDRVGLGPLVERCSAGIDTLVGESYLQLSGGEKQRLGLARALYSNPRVLVLDEPTSALDGLSEDHVFDLLEAERDQRTIIVITHRRPAGFEFDRVFQVEGGRVLSA
jgi:ABC-type multidrug transport system fused ATPase/permease subunit